MAKFIIDEELMNLLEETYQKNLKSFKEQNTGLLINNVGNLYDSDVIKFLENTVGTIMEGENIQVDKRFIDQHFDNFTVSPEIVDLKTKFVFQADLLPDISCVKYR